MRHYKPRLVYFFTQFSLWLRLILQTIYVLKMEILHFSSSKSAAYKQERLQIESGLWWRTYGNFFQISYTDFGLHYPRNEALTWRSFCQLKWKMQETYGRTLKISSVITLEFSTHHDFIWMPNLTMWLHHLFILFFLPSNQKITFSNIMHNSEL